MKKILLAFGLSFSYSLHADIRLICHLVDTGVNRMGDYTIKSNEHVSIHYPERNVYFDIDVVERKDDVVSIYCDIRTYDEHGNLSKPVSVMIPQEWGHYAYFVFQDCPLKLAVKVLGVR